MPQRRKIYAQLDNRRCEAALAAIAEMEEELSEARNVLVSTRAIVRRKGGGPLRQPVTGAKSYLDRVQEALNDAFEAIKHDEEGELIEIPEDED